MIITMTTDQRLEKDVEAAFQIALGFLRAKGQVADERRTGEFLAESIIRRLQRGERHKILLANHAIGDYEDRFLVEHVAND
jgi:hypothetical protein